MCGVLCIIAEELNTQMHAVLKQGYAAAVIVTELCTYLSVWYTAKPRTVRKKELKEHDIVIKQVSQMNYTILKEDSNEERFHRVM